MTRRAFLPSLIAWLCALSGGARPPAFRPALPLRDGLVRQMAHWAG
ncbi:MAG: hypothetical protein FWG50_02395 [Kiritimatiellaeota bacterium]|nr:hypothetical protein [Kiritimatiellota bacterium]